MMTMMRTLRMMMNGKTSNNCFGFFLCPLKPLDDYDTKMIRLSIKKYFISKILNEMFHQFAVYVCCLYAFFFSQSVQYLI